MSYGIATDASVPYQEHKVVFERHGFTLFDGMDIGILAINILKRSR